MKQILAEYESKCSECVSPSVRLAMREAIEQEKLMSKRVHSVGRRGSHCDVRAPEMQKTPEKKKPASAGSGRSRSRSQSRKRAQKKGEPASGQVLIDRFVKREPPPPSPGLWPRGAGAAADGGAQGQAVHRDFRASSLIGKGFYALTKVELMDCLLQPDSLKSFGDSTQSLQNTHGDHDGCKELCRRLIGNKYLKTLSLCYRSHLSSGKYCWAICQSAVVDLFSRRQRAEAEGVIYLVDSLAEYAEDEAKRREEEAQRKLQEAAERKRCRYKCCSANHLDHFSAPKDRYTYSTSSHICSSASEAKPDSAKSSKSGKKKGGKKGRKKGRKERAEKKAERRAERKVAGRSPSSGQAIEPVIRKLHLADNGIDQVGRGANFVCLKSVIRLGSIVRLLPDPRRAGPLLGQRHRRCGAAGWCLSSFRHAKKKLGSGIKKRKRGKRGSQKEESYSMPNVHGQSKKCLSILVLLLLLATGLLIYHLHQGMPAPACSCARRSPQLL
uniref:MSC domain-containing protein n=1 Tax=Macrostomum lignano TaxID=282301 RepID=A0A1I8JR74_9PLAT